MLSFDCALFAKLLDPAHRRACWVPFVSDWVTALLASAFTFLSRDADLAVSIIMHEFSYCCLLRRHLMAIAEHLLSSIPSNLIKQLMLVWNDIAPCVLKLIVYFPQRVVYLLPRPTLEANEWRWVCNDVKIRVQEGEFLFHLAHLDPDSMLRIDKQIHRFELLRKAFKRNPPAFSTFKSPAHACLIHWTRRHAIEHRTAFNDLSIPAFGVNYVFTHLHVLISGC